MSNKLQENYISIKVELKVRKHKINEAVRFIWYFKHKSKVFPVFN